MKAGPGRPPGSKDKAPAIPTRLAKQALEGVKQRAQDGSAEDQRALLVFYAATTRASLSP